MFVQKQNPKHRLRMARLRARERAQRAALSTVKGTFGDFDDDYDDGDGDDGLMSAAAVTRLPPELRSMQRLERRLVIVFCFFKRLSIQI
jgi:hypothetical protein